APSSTSAVAPAASTWRRKRRARASSAWTPTRTPSRSASSSAASAAAATSARPRRRCPSATAPSRSSTAFPSSSTSNPSSSPPAIRRASRWGPSGRWRPSTIASRASRRSSSWWPARREPTVKRTILFATEYWPPFAPGGAEWTNAAWAEALARRGHRVIVVTPDYGASPREERDGVLVVRPPFSVKLRPGQQEAGWLLHKNPLFHAWVARWTRRVAEAEGVDLVHAQNKGAPVGAWRAARALGRPLAVTVRDVGLLCPVGACPLFGR